MGHIGEDEEAGDNDSVSDSIEQKFAISNYYIPNEKKDGANDPKNYMEAAVHFFALTNRLFSINPRIPTKNPELLHPFYSVPLI